MAVIIRPIGMLKDYFNNQSTVTVEAGKTVREILVSAHIPPELVAGVIVNGELQSKDYILQDE